MAEQAPTLVVSFRAKKVELPLIDGTTAAQVKELLLSETNDPSLRSSDIKLIVKGKVLHDDNDIHRILTQSGTTMKSVYRLVATGVSPAQVHALEQQEQHGRRLAPRVRDDLTDAGRAEKERQRRLGQILLRNAANRKREVGNVHGFGRIEVLPNLPDQERAREILTQLANDPGILACMAKHKWNVGILSELYPEGNVGESAVCLGLNEDKGERIRLRLRTDDLQGFRKMLSIRKVLYHELAHNVHSEHDGEFFQLMRKIERECTEQDWTHGAGLSSSTTLYTGGAFRLGGDVATRGDVPLRELAAQAALSRMTAEEKEIEENCGCGRRDLFLPQSGSHHETKDSKSMDA